MTELEVGRHDTVDVEVGSTGSTVEPVVTVTAPGGSLRRIPAFLRADGSWHIRYSSDELGRHEFTSGSGAGGAIVVHEYDGANELLRHGAPVVSADGHYLRHTDGQPFLWLADTWWFALVDRVGWGEALPHLAEQRHAAGFTAIQLVAGLFPEIGPFEDRGRSVGGWPWLEEFSAPNPAWWDAADARIQALVDAGLVPVLVGAWGYYLDWLGVERMQRHWRTMVARWGSLPVIWCLGGEANMPHYETAFAHDANDDGARLAGLWAEVGAYVREIDPFGRVLTTHPGPAVGQWRSTDGAPDGLFDLDLLQSGHEGAEALLKGVDLVIRIRAEELPIPVINSELIYEGIMGTNWADLQRLAFWTHMLSGAAGHSYGAQGLWAVDDGAFSGAPGVWGRVNWEQAAQLPGAVHLGAGARILARLEWQGFQPHPEWIEPHVTADRRFLPYAAGTDGVRIFYIPPGTYTGIIDDDTRRPVLRELTFIDLPPGSTWRGEFVDPQTADVCERFVVSVAADADRAVITGSGLSPCPSMEDWVIILRAQLA